MKFIGELPSPEEAVARALREKLTCPLERLSTKPGPRKIQCIWMDRNMQGELIWWGGEDVIGFLKYQRRESVGWLILIVAREERISRCRA